MKEKTQNILLCILSLVLLCFISLCIYEFFDMLRDHECYVNGTYNEPQCQKYNQGGR